MSWNSSIAVIAVLTIVTALASAPAKAQEDEPEYGSPGFYVGFGVSGVMYNGLDDELEDELESLDLVVPFDSDGTTSLNAYAGYRVHRFFSAEVEFEKLAESTSKISHFGTVADIESWALMGNLKAYPLNLLGYLIDRDLGVLTGRIQPFVLVGAGLLHTEVDDDPATKIEREDLAQFGGSLPRFGGNQQGFAARFGGGVELYLNERFVVWTRSTYVLPTGSVDGFDYVTYGGGIQFNF